MLLRKVMWLAILPAAVSMLDNAGAQDLRLTPVASLYDGGLSDVRFIGDLVYVAGASGLEILDVADPSHPHNAGEVLCFAGIQSAAVVPAGIALAENDSLLFFALPVSGTPERGSGLKMNGYIRKLEYYHDYLYFVDDGGWGRITCHNLHAPALDYYQPSAIAANSLAFSSDSLLLACTDGLIRVVQLGVVPQQIGAFPWRPDITSLASNPPLLMAACGDSGVFVANYHAPSDGGGAGRFYTYGTAVQVWPGPTGLCVADIVRGLLVLNLDDPENPYLMGLNTDAQGLRAISGYGTIIAGVADNGVFLFDVSNPSAPQTVGHFGGAYHVRDLAGAGSTLLAAIDGAGLALIDVTNFAVPRVLSETPAADKIYGLDAEGCLAALACGEDGIILYEFSNPASPAEVFRETTIGTACDVALDDTLAIVADFAEGFRIFDVSDPANTRLIGGKSIDRPVTAVARRGNIVFLTGRDAGFRAYDISFAFKPKEVYRFNVDDREGRDIFLCGNRAFCAMDSDGVYVFDISQPMRPRFVDHWSCANHPRRIVGEGALFHILDDSAGVLMIDYRLPGEPKIINATQLSAPATAAIFKTDTLYLAGGPYLFTATVDPPVQAGDMDEDGQATLLDAVAFVYYLFRDAPPPLRTATMDFDGDGRLSMVDLVRCLRLLFPR